MNDKYVLILCSLNPDRSDIGGTIYPESGYIEAINWKPTSNIREGLHGTLFGKCCDTKWVNTDPDAKFCVISTSRNDDIIILDKDRHFVKFRSGMVVYSGSRYQCCKYIESHSNECLDNFVDRLIDDALKMKRRWESDGSVTTQKKTLVVAREGEAAVALADECQGMAGVDGILILGYYDNSRFRLKVGYVGEDIEADEIYRIENGEFVKVS